MRCAQVNDTRMRRMLNSDQYVAVMLRRMPSDGPLSAKMAPRSDSRSKYGTNRTHMAGWQDAVEERRFAGVSASGRAPSIPARRTGWVRRLPGHRHRRLRSSRSSARVRYAPLAAYDQLDRGRLRFRISTLTLFSGMATRCYDSLAGPYSNKAGPLCLSGENAISAVPVNDERVAFSGDRERVIHIRPAIDTRELGIRVGDRHVYCVTAPVAAIWIQRRRKYRGRQFALLSGPRRCCRRSRRKERHPNE